MLFKRTDKGTHVECSICGIRFKLRKKDAVAVIDLAGIGDYVLRHNFLSYIKKSEKYKNKKLILIEWNHTASLCEYFDSPIVDGFWWLDVSFFKPWGKKFLKNKFKEFNIETVICPCAGKSPYEEAFLSIVKPKIVIGHVFEQANKVEESRKYSLYTKLVKTTSNQVFEFNRNKEFYEKVLNLKINLTKPFFESQFNKEDNYIFISPFAGDIKRVWNAENYAKLINYIVENYNYKCVILGSRYDVHSVTQIIDKIKEKNKNNVINAVNKTTIGSLPNILKNYAKLLIANETGTVHIAAAVDCPFIVLSKGSYYKRFQPYSGLEDAYIYPNEFDKKIKRGDDYSQFYSEVELDINEISFDKVKNKISDILKKL